MIVTSEGDATEKSPKLLEDISLRCISLDMTVMNWGGAHHPSKSCRRQLFHSESKCLELW